VSDRPDFRHRRLVSHGSTAGAYPLGPGAGSEGQVRDARTALHSARPAAPRQILQWFLWRWQVEVTFQEVRSHLGVETQRQWSDLAIVRTTPVLLGLFSIVTLLAHRLARNGHLPIRQSAWYIKAQPTFSDAIAALRHQLWHPTNFFTSRSELNIMKIPRALFSGLCHAVCYAA